MDGALVALDWLVRSPNPKIQRNRRTSRCVLAMGLPFVGPHASREPPRRPHWRHWRGRRSAHEPRTTTPRAEPAENRGSSSGPMPCSTSRRRADPAFISAARPPLPQHARQRPSAPGCEAEALCPGMRRNDPLPQHATQRPSAPPSEAEGLCAGGGSNGALLHGVEHGIGHARVPQEVADHARSPTPSTRDCRRRAPRTRRGTTPSSPGT